MALCPGFIDLSIFSIIFVEFFRICSDHWEDANPLSCPHLGPHRLSPSSSSITGLKQNKTKSKDPCQPHKTSKSPLKDWFSHQKFGFWLTQTSQEPSEFVKVSWSFWNSWREEGMERFGLFFPVIFHGPRVMAGGWAGVEELQSSSFGRRSRPCTAVAGAAGESMLSFPCLPKPSPFI